MKRLTIVVLICFVIIPNIISQTKVPITFLDFEWGDSKQKVKNVMLKREGVTFYETGDYDTRLSFDRGKFANLPIFLWSFRFYKNKLAGVTITFEDRKQSVGEYLLDELIKKYGEPSDNIIDGTEHYIFWAEFDNDSIEKNGVTLTRSYESTNSVVILLLYNNSNLTNKLFEYIDTKKNEGIQKENEERQKGIDEL